jgi:hypothetical protein
VTRTAGLPLSFSLEGPHSMSDIQPYILFFAISCGIWVTLKVWRSNLWRWRDRGAGRLSRGGKSSAASALGWCRTPAPGPPSAGATPITSRSTK